MFSTYLPIGIPEFSHHHVTFLLINPFQYPTINIRNHVWVHWFDWCEGLLDLLNVKRRPSNCVQIFTYEDVSVCNLSRNFSRFISTNMFSHKAVVYETWSCACSHTKRLVSAHLLTYEKCLCVTFNISHRVFHLWPTWNDVQPHDFNLQNILSMQILSYETMPENTDLTNTKASCETCSL